MNLKLTLRLIGNLQKLIHGDSIPYSAIPKSLSESLVKEGLLNVVIHGSRRSLRTHNTDALAGALPRYNEALKDLGAAEALLNADGSRAAQAAISGNSKTRGERSCPGFLVNTFSPVHCRLNQCSFTVCPAEGTAVYIADWTSFIPPENAIVVGVENMENFLKIRSQKKFFVDYFNQKEVPLLFVARYAFSLDLVHWLQSLPNHYLHFGDFDLAGIEIFLKQFKPYVGNRGAFLIPSDIEYRISQGSLKRYDDQYRKYSGLKSDDSGISRLISLIHKYRRTYDQEGYIDNR